MKIMKMKIMKIMQMKTCVRAALAVAIMIWLSCPWAGAQAAPSSTCAELESKVANAQKQLSDWPNLARYRDANGKVPSPAGQEQRVVFMGDSITDFWNHPEFGGFFPGKPYLDRGISGQTTPQMLIRFRPNVIALRPKVVVILAGTNDIAGNTGPMTLEDIEANLQSMSDLARSNKIRVVLASLLPVSNYGHDRQGNPVDVRTRRPPDKILELNAWIKKYAKENDYVYLDYFSAMVDDKGLLKQDLSEDGLHPNAKGYAVMAPLAEQAIQTALKRSPIKALGCSGLFVVAATLPPFSPKSLPLSSWSVAKDLCTLLAVTRGATCLNFLPKSAYRE